METAITALIVISLLALSIMMLTERSMAAQATLSQSFQQMQERAGERARTSLTPLGAVMSGDTVWLTLKNTGTVKLADLNRWDVILQCNMGATWQTQWYPYTSSALNPGQWTAAITDTIETGILNPGEEMVLRVRVSATPASPTINLATVAVPNGVTASAAFGH